VVLPEPQAATSIAPPTAAPRTTRVRRLAWVIDLTSQTSFPM
jgi:hypothetical protein